MGLVENTTKPEFLATVFMELRRAKGNGKPKFFVQVLLKDNEPDQPINLRKVTITGKIKTKDIRNKTLYL